MQNELEIELQEETAEESGSVQLPMNFLTFGEIENDDIKVYIKQDVYKALEKLSASDTSTELGSILIGDFCQALGKPHVVVSEYIEAKYTDASASTLTFTHETWDYVHAEHEKRCPDKKIICWQHTHPSYGIFLSNYDLFIHENFFNLPFQIAYVIDPVQNLRGFFQWKNGKIEKLKGYYIYDDVGKPIKIEQKKEKTSAPAPAKSFKPLVVLSALLCVAIVLLSVLGIRTYRSILGTLAEQADTISALQAQLDSGSEELMAAEVQQMLENHTLMLQNQAAALAELQSLAENTECDPDEARFIIYTVAAGDTLAEICAAHGLEYRENAGLIVALNGLQSADLIYVGQKLLLPLAN